jgi:PleD family two-component response regulator
MITNEKAAILIVDDNRNNIELVNSILKKRNYDIYTALSGKKAFEILASTRIDLVLLDVMMPEMDGFEVCVQMKKDAKYKEIPVIFLSAHNNSDAVVKGFEVGGADYIPKPFHNEELIARVKHHVELKQTKELIQKQLEELQQANRFIMGVLHQYSKYVETNKGKE